MKWHPMHRTAVPQAEKLIASVDVYKPESIDLRQESYSTLAFAHTSKLGRWERSMSAESMCRRNTKCISFYSFSSWYHRSNRLHVTFTKVDSPRGCRPAHVHLNRLSWIRAGTCSHVGAIGVHRDVTSPQPGNTDRSRNVAVNRTLEKLEIIRCGPCPCAAGQVKNRNIDLLELTASSVTVQTQT